MRKYQRRTQAEWQSIVDDQNLSHLSALVFCKQRDISYPSFLQWKKRLNTVRTGSASPENVPAFVEITASENNVSDPDLPRSSSPRLELDLGRGIQLRIYHT